MITVGGACVRRTGRAVVLAALVAGLGACGGGGGAQSYDSLEQLQADLVEGGVQCGQFSATDLSEVPDAPAGLRAGGSCLSNGQALGIFFADEGAVDELERDFVENQVFQNAVVGPNFMIATDDSGVADQVREAVGGTINRS